MIGLISMCLTIVNILSIYVAGVWLFIFKEVAPVSYNGVGFRFPFPSAPFIQQTGLRPKYSYVSASCVQATQSYLQQQQLRAGRFGSVRTRDNSSLFVAFWKFEVFCFRVRSC